MAHFFAALDGDNAGSHVGQAVLHDDVEALADISSRIDSANQAVKQWVEAHGGKMISFGGDESTFMIEAESLEALGDMIEELRDQYQQVSGFTVTAGIGESLSQAGKALMAGKLVGKDMVMEYNDHVEAILEEAHNHAGAGEGTEEEEKLDEAYLGDLFGDEDGAEMEPKESIEPGYLHDEGEEEPGDEGQEEEHGDEEQPASHEHFDGEEHYLEGEDEDEEQSAEMLDGDEEGSQDLQEQPSESSFGDLEGVAGDADVHSPIGQEIAPEHVVHGEDSEDEESLNFQDAKNMMAEPSEEAPESNFENEEPIQIAGAVDQESEEPKMDEELSTEEEAKANENAQEASPEGEEEVNPEMEAFGQMVDEGVQEDDEALKNRIAQALAKFKEQKPVLEAAASQAPELYEASLEILKVMIDMARRLFPPQEEDQPEQVEVPSGSAPSEEAPKDPKI